MGPKIQPAGSITVKDMWKEGHDTEWVLLAGLGHDLVGNCFHHLRRGNVLRKLLLCPPGNMIRDANLSS